jgi:hypothetical protein
MDMASRKQYLLTLLERYLKVRKRQKGSILDEFCRNTGQNRKYVIRKISRLASTEPRPPRKRAPRYGPETARPLERLWKMFDYPCGQRLKPLLETELDRLRRLKEIEVSGQMAEKLRTVSPATIDRLLRPKKEAWKLHHKSGTKGPGLIAKKIPLRMGTGKSLRVGDVDMDLVLHCGSSTAGEYGHSLSTLDLGSAWWEAEVVMGRAQRRIFNALKEIEARSPFPWKSIHSDNDNAFINGQLYDYAEQRHYGFTRSRPYRKNDNPHIEQKNFTHVRKPLGYLRYDTPEELALIEDLYRHELRLFKNFFQPVMMLERKVRVSGRPKRTYSPAKTPYHRLIESGQLSPEKVRELKALYLSLNPAELKRQIDRKLTKLYDLYRKKRKRPITVNPYKKQVPSMVTFLVSEQSQLGLPD